MINYYLLFLLDDRRIRIRILEDKKHVDPDSEHCCTGYRCYCTLSAIKILKLSKIMCTVQMVLYPLRDYHLKLSQIVLSCHLKRKQYQGLNISKI
jgi:hypothetical protein